MLLIGHCQQRKRERERRPKELENDRRGSLLYALESLTGKKEDKSKSRLPAPTLMRRKPEAKTKIGINDPCPCGSGKKFKNCCMKKEFGKDF